jgi:hypothetical protein
MLRSVDGSWRALARAPGDIVPVALKNNNDLAYLATVQMGTPQQQIAMSPSLSQDYISVASAPEGVTSTAYYNPGISSSYVASNDVATVQTVSGGSFTGHFAGETCMLQSASASFSYEASVVMTDNTVRDLYPEGANGILGYGVNLPTGVDKSASLIDSFLPATFTNAVCGVELNHMDDPVPDGILTMGAVDPTAFSGDFTNVIVLSDSPFSWSVPFDKLTYMADGTPSDLPGLTASIDMLHTGIQLPTHMAQKIYSCVKGSHPISDTVWSIPCDSKFPITLTFGGRSFKIDERDTVKRQADGTCHGVVTGGADKVAAVGAPFMRNFYTQFGVNKTSDGSAVAFVGFATKKQRQK